LWQTQRAFSTIIRGKIEMIIEPIKIFFENEETNNGFRIDKEHALYQHNNTVYLVKINDSNEASDTGLILSECYKKSLTEEKVKSFMDSINSMDSWSFLTDMIYQMPDEANLNLIK
jgi:hypothetical protein